MLNLLRFKPTGDVPDDDVSARRRTGDTPAR
jgi:hypothetical protein